MNTIRKADLLQKRRWRIRKKVFGTQQKPRLAVRFTSKHIYAQAIDDTTSSTLAFMCTLDASARQDDLSANIAGAKKLGYKFSESLKSAGIKTIVFDRSGALYHGKVRAFADELRANGLIF